MEKRRIGVGLISVGWMGNLHTRAFKSLKQIYPELEIEIDLVIAADTAEDRANYAKDVLGYRESTTNYQDVLSHPDVDVVSICSPNFLHKEMGVAAANAKKAFWIEKPVGRGADETMEVEAAAVKNNVTTTIGFNYRHPPVIEYARQIIADGKLGQITNVRGSYFADYSAEPNGALSWRFVRKTAGSGVLGDLMGHLVDQMHYILGPISEVIGSTKTVITERPVLAMGSGTHFDVIEGGPKQAVENEDYASMLIKFADNAVASGAIGTLEASRVAVGPRASYNFEIYGTNGSLKWDFERLNELELAIGRQGPNVGYQRIMANHFMGDFAKFQPGSGVSMGYDDLKIIEARKFIESFIGGQQLNSNIHDAVAAAKVVSAAEDSAKSKNWIKISPTSGITAAIKKGDK
jgi:predicted dehydrogenase